MSMIIRMQNLQATSRQIRETGIVKTPLEWMNSFYVQKNHHCSFDYFLRNLVTRNNT